jgi:hypothetical protein
VAHASATRVSATRVMSMSSVVLGHNLLACVAIGAKYRRAGAPSLKVQLCDRAIERTPPVSATDTHTSMVGYSR